MQRMLESWGICTAMLIAAAAIGGCGEAGPDRATVSGNVTFDGNPVEDGTIAFYPTGGTEGPVTGGPITNGSYTLTGTQGPVIGQHKVEIRANRETGETMPAVPPATGDFKVTEQYVPAQFNEQTTLTADIKAGENTHNFELEAE